MAASGSPDVKLNRDGTPCRVVKRSKIWEIFTIVADDPSKAICTECKGVISRGGGTGKSQCTTNLWKHIQNRHPLLFDNIHKYKEVAHRIPEKSISKLSKVTDTSVLGHPNASRIWDLFSIDESDPSLAKCLNCSIEITRSIDDMTTDVLWYHIMNDHPESYTKCVAEAIENVVLKNKSCRRSAIWEEFTQHPIDLCKVICNTCETVISRGSSKDRLNTTNMRRHLVGNLHINALRSKGLSEHQNEVLEVVEDLEKQEILSMFDTEKKNSLASSSGLEISKSAPVSKVANSAEHSNLVDASAVVRDRSVDLIHTGLIGNALYIQQQVAMCCDFTIVVRNRARASQSARRKAMLNNKNEEVAFPTDDCAEEYKIHSCIACIVSEKLRGAVESGSKTLTLADITKDTVLALIEVMYTGKLKGVGAMKKQQLQEIYDLAQLLAVPTVIEFLKRSHPKLEFHVNSNPHEHSLTLPASQSRIGQRILPAISVKGGPMVSEDPVNSNLISLHSLEPNKAEILSNSPVHENNKRNQILGGGDGMATQEDFVDNNSAGSHPLEVDGVEQSLVRQSDFPKVNKRKNYMPISTGNSSKMSKVKNNSDIEENGRDEIIQRFSSNASCSDEFTS